MRPGEDQVSEEFEASVCKTAGARDRADKRQEPRLFQFEEKWQVEKTKTYALQTFEYSHVASPRKTQLFLNKERHAKFIRLFDPILQKLPLIFYVEM